MSMSIDYEKPLVISKYKIFTSDDIDDKFGFVYCITNNTNGRQYIGRKYFWKFRTPKGKKRKVKSESDWKNYYGSCPELKEEIQQLGKQNFSRVILSLHNTKGPNKLRGNQTTLCQRSSYRVTWRRNTEVLQQ